MSEQKGEDHMCSRNGIPHPQRQSDASSEEEKKNEKIIYITASWISWQKTPPVGYRSRKRCQLDITAENAASRISQQKTPPVGYHSRKHLQLDITAENSASRIL